MKIPCLNKKCILLPVCKQKMTIDCIYILEYYKTSITNRIFVENFERLHQILPNMKILSKNKTFIRIYEFYKSAIAGKELENIHSRRKILECDMVQTYIKSFLLNENNNDI